MNQTLQIKTAALLFCILLFSMRISAQLCADGVLTLTNPAVSDSGGTGTEADPYNPCNFTMEVCFDLERFNEIGLNWAHGVFLANVPAGASITSAYIQGGASTQSTTYQSPAIPLASSESAHQWIYIDQATIDAGGFAGSGTITEPGFYVDYDDDTSIGSAGYQGDGDPTNNFGDQGDGGILSLVGLETYTLEPFCFQMEFTDCSAKRNWRPIAAVSGDGVTGDHSALLGTGTILCDITGITTNTGGPNGDGTVWYGEGADPDAGLACASGSFSNVSVAGGTAGDGSNCAPYDCSGGGNEFTYDICFDLERYGETLLNWAHGVFVQNLPAGATIAVNTGVQPTADGETNQWIFMDETAAAGVGLTYPGFYVDYDDNDVSPGYQGDGDPTNNYGDKGNSGATLAVPEVFDGSTGTNINLAPFCLTVTFSDCSATADCWTPNLGISGDGETGFHLVPDPLCLITSVSPTEGGPNGDGSVCYGVAPPRPANDDPFGAVDISSIIADANFAPVGWSCDGTARTYSSAGSVPSTSVVQGDGADACDATNKNDIWFFIDHVMENDSVWLDFYSDRSGNSADLVAALYSGTPGGNSCTGITGLTYIDCTDGDAGLGGDRDVGECSTPLHERLDLSGLATGRYYLRLWQDGNTVPAAADFYICAESSTPITVCGTEEYGGFDGCNGSLINAPGGGIGTTKRTLGCLSTDENTNISITYLSQSNAGTFGASNVSCTGLSEPLVAGLGLGVGRADYGCTGTYELANIYVNNVINNNVFYGFNVNAGGCLAGLTGVEGAEVTLKFDNIVVCCGEENIQIQVQPGDCVAGTAVMAASMDVSGGQNCISMKPSLLTGVGAPILPDGDYFISVEGQNGALVSFDLTLDIDYTAGGLVTCTDNPTCGDPIDQGNCAILVPVELALFEGEAVGKNNELTWTTLSEFNNDYFEVEKSKDGRRFETIGKVNGQGTSSTIHDYFMADRTPYDLTYYRLKIVATDGMVEYSEIINISRNSRSFGIYGLAPVPAKDMVKLSFKNVNHDRTTIRISDLLGRTVSLLEVENQMDRVTDVDLDISNLGNGVYFISAESGSEISTQKLLVQ